MDGVVVLCRFEVKQVEVWLPTRLWIRRVTQDWRRVGPVCQPLRGRRASDPGSWVLQDKVCMLPRLLSLQT